MEYSICRRGLAMRILSVRLSVKLVICDETKESYARILIPHERPYPSFVIRRWLVGTITSTSNFVSTGPRWSEIADFQPIFARSASAVTPSEKKFNSQFHTNRN